jgi:succinate dehydrogenase / fumarate reductase cytochrome b subunit
MSAYGQPGIEHMLRVLREELEKCMRLCGVTSLDQLSPDHVNANELTKHTTRVIIPKSPYSLAHVRNRRDVSEKKSLDVKEEILEEIAKLRSKLNALDVRSSSSEDSAKTKGSSGILVVFGVLVTRVLAALMRGFFVLDSRMAIHRTAMVLLAYLVVHLAGNLSIFAGPTTFNGYAAFLHNLGIVPYVEYYLLIATTLHIVMTIYRSYKMKVLRGVTTKPMSVFRRLYLLISGIVIMGFLWVHLQHFRFSPNLSVAAVSENVTDLYSQMQHVFANDITVVGYLASLLSIGIHLWHGWDKAVHKMNLDRAHDKEMYLRPVQVMGKFLVVGLIFGFGACIAKARSLSQV